MSLIQRYRHEIIELCNTMASKRGPESDPENFMELAGQLRLSAGLIDDPVLTDLANTLIKQRRADAGMEDE